jgi:anti-sigma factor RsiW
LEGAVLTETIEQMEIDAYIDGELDATGRLKVEDYLARHPNAAAQVMADLRARSALQLLASTEAKPSLSLASAISRLRTAADRRPIWRRRALGGAVAATTGLVAFLCLLPEASTPPAYVRLAVASHRSISDRPSNVVVPAVSNRTRILLSASRIAVPKLPTGWHVTDVQLLSAAKGPAMLLAVRTTEGRDFSIFAVRERSSAPEEPDTVREGAQSVAYWSAGDISYALTGDEDPNQLDATADALADSWQT